MAEASSLLARLVEALPAMVDDLERLVCCESPTSDLEATSRCAARVADIGGRLLGARPEWAHVHGRPHLLWRFGQDPQVLLLGHLDTVWPVGTLRGSQFAVVDGRATGPGCFDMKAGLVQLLYAVAAVDDRAGVTVLVTSDEEIGSPTSRSLIESEARRAEAVLVLEASENGALKTSRKGAESYRVQVTGRAAHAGLEPERGANATVELAHQVLALAALSDPARQTTVTPTAMACGITANTVPASGSVTVDVRAFTVEEQQRVAAAMRALPTTVAGTTIDVEAIGRRPPLPPSASERLFAQAQAAATKLGLPLLRGIAVGGASDGNLAAGVGSQTLDGLGAVGGGAHADDEHVLVAEMPARAALVAQLVRDLLHPAGRDRMVGSDR